MNRMLRAPLIKTATLLAVVSLLVYLTATSPEGSLWSSLGTLFSASFSIVQLGLGLIVSLLFCLVVLTGIFLACYAMISMEGASKMLEQIRQAMSDKLLLVRSMVIRDTPSKGTKELEEYGSGLKKDMQVAMEGSLEEIRNDSVIATDKLASLMQRMDHVEKGEDVALISAQLIAQEQKMEEAASRVDVVQSQLSTLQDKIDELIRFSQDEKYAEDIKQQTDRIDNLEKLIASVQEELSSVKDSYVAEEVKGKSAEAAGKTSQDHRLFSHVKNKSMQEKIEQLVTETLDNDMSYAQVIDHLVQNTSGKTADAIASHPSLTKEYIRYRRKNG